MNFSAFVPVDRLEEANKTLEEQGFGPANFSIPVKTEGATRADVAALHCWTNPVFQAAIEALGYATIEEAVTIVDNVPVPTGKPNLEEVLVKEKMEWVQPVGADDPNIKNKGDRVTIDGKTWESLIDNNVWKPPVGWREVVAQGFPAWVQPTGAHDAYKKGDKVVYKKINYESLLDANVWSPEAYPAGWKKL